MSNIFARTYDENVIPKKQNDDMVNAVRVACHKEDQKNNLAPMNNKDPKFKVGKEGLKGDGQTM